MVVLRALGVIREFGEVGAEYGETFVPDMGRYEVYRRGMERQVRVYGSLLG
jgi:hypothetical protein